MVCSKLVFFLYYSIAKCLGARRVAKRTYEWLSLDTIFSEAVPDEEAVKACVRFYGILSILQFCIIITGVFFYRTDDHGVTVPPACGAALSAVYSGVVLKLLADGKVNKPFNNVLVVVCGGSGVDIDKLEEWRSKYLK